MTFLLRQTCFVGLSAAEKQGGRQLIRVKSQIVVQPDKIQELTIFVEIHLWLFAAE